MPNRELDLLLTDEDPHSLDPHCDGKSVTAPHLDSAVVMEPTYSEPSRLRKAANTSTIRVLRNAVLPLKLQSNNLDPRMSQTGLGRVKTLCEKGKVGNFPDWDTPSWT
jgi:hypothetical protein